MCFQFLESTIKIYTHIYIYNHTSAYIHIFSGLVNREIDR